MENKSKIKSDLRNKEYAPEPTTTVATVTDAPSPDVQPIVESYSDNESEKSKSVAKKDLDSDADSDNESIDSEKSPVLSDSASDSDSDGGGSKPTSGSKVKSNEAKANDNANDKSKPRSKDIISARLKELLGDKKPVEESQKQPNSHLNAPSLSELEKTGKITVKKELGEIAHTTLSQQEQEDAKSEILFKFDILKKSYKTDTIPEFSIHSDYETMKKSYETTLRTLSLDKSVEDYKRYLLGGFMLMEFVFGNWLGFDMQGFTQQQIISMSSYERLLIELGEKSYIPTGSRWPVEVRLLFLVVMNGAFFVIGKMILKKTGSNLMGMINNMNAAVPQNNAKKRKMKGPSINVDDIPDVDE